MLTRRMLVFVAATAVLVPLVRPFRASDASSRDLGQRQTPLEHFVFIHKENRSFDHYFGKFPGANGATRGEMHDGTEIDLIPAPDPMPQDPGHFNEDWILAYNDGEMNGFDLERKAWTPDGDPIVYSQFSEEGIPNYWAYARRFGLGDNYFHDYQGATFANNLFRYAAQTGREEPSTGFRAATGLPSGVSRGGRTHLGCDEPPDFIVEMTAADDTTSSAWTCFSFKALPNILSDFDLPWRQYGDPDHDSFAFVLLDAIAQVRYDPDQWGNVRALDQFEADAASGDLGAVSWVQPINAEHAGFGVPVCEGENETVRIVNAVMNGPDWESTAIVITWDEWGGFYDHQAPPIVDNLSFGFRTPLLVISPWVKYGGGSDGGYISNTFFSHGSPLKLVETNWNLPSLNSRDAGSNDMMDFFDFQQTPKGPLILSERSCPDSLDLPPLVGDDLD